MHPSSQQRLDENDNYLCFLELPESDVFQPESVCATAKE
jgi:hypothetical protein